MPGFVTCGPNEALVVSGCCHRRPLMVPGGRVFVWPVVQKVQRINLNTMTLTIESPRVYTQQGVPISVTGIAQVKIQGQNADMLRAACEQFLGKSEHEIMNVARETLEGHQRAIMASMTVEEIYKNRKKFSKKVFEVASSDLVDMGFTVVSYTIKDISDEEGYLKALGLARTAEVKRDARIGEAEAKRDALIKEALAEEERMASRYMNDAEIAKAQRDFELKKAAYDVEVFSKKAESDLAYNLQAAKTRQRIKEEQMQVKVIERTQEIQVQEQEIMRKERELDATVRRPAEAEKYKLEKLAEAHRNKIIMEAEAEAEALRLRGEAEAFAIEAKAKAEAEQMAKKANAYKEYDVAAKIDMVLETLPKIAAEVAAPLAQCNKVVMVSNGSSEVGAGKLTGEVLDIITKVHLTVAQMTGTTLSNSPGSMMGPKKAEASKDRNFHKDREQYISSTRSRSPQRISQNRSTSQEFTSPYSKPYHSYRTSERRRNEEMSTKSSPRLSSDDRPKSATHSEPIKIPAQERRNSAQEVYDKRLPQSPTKRSERRSSSNGDIGRVDKKNEGKGLKLRLEELEDGEIDESNGLPSSTDANVSEVSAGNGERVVSPVVSVSSSVSSSNNMQIQEALNKPNKGSARKGFLRGVVTTEQHDKQTKFLNAVRANSKVVQQSANPENSSTIQTRIHTKKGLPSSEANSSSTEKAKKTFVMPLPPGSTDKTSQQELNLSQDESSSHSTSTPGTPKRKKRHYKGGTYNLYLSKKRKKIKENKKSKETESNADTHVSQEGEESSQSFAANSESDGDLDGESSISSNADNEDEHEVNQNDEHEIVNQELVEEYVEEVSQEELVNDCEEIALNIDENSNTERPEVLYASHKVDNEVNKTSDSGMSSPKKGQTTQSSSSSIIDSVKNRPRSKRKVDGEEVGYLSPTSNNSKPKPEDGKQSSPQITATTQASQSESPKILNGSPVRSSFQFPSNNATPSVIENPNRKTLLKISTAGSVESGDTHGTYIGVEQSKFVMINDKTVSQSVNCLCSAKPLINSSEISKGKPMFCQAIDCFDEKLIGCCNHVRLTSLFRSSKRLPYRILCEVHLARLRRHHCCPGCGLFCTQGEFLECFCVKKQIHLFHKKCQIDKPPDPKSQRCLHCNNVSTARTVRLEMNGPLTNNTYYLQQTSVLKTPKARISMFKKKGKQIDRVLEDFEEPGIEYIIPATKKILSLAGLPLGPQRKQLEDLLTTISADKQSNIKLTIQHNKNFYAVAKSGEIDKVLSILAQGFDSNYTFVENDNETPLHAAASSGHLVIVHLLIQSGANPNVLNKNMTTPLMQAIENKHNLVVKYLINAGASLDIRGEDGMTTLHIGAKSGNIEAVHYIINSGRMNVNLQDDGGWSALVWATEHKHYNIVKLLVSKGADPNIEDDEENLGLHWAAFSGESNIALLFLEMGSDKCINHSNIHGDTPLHIASRRDNYECVILLLSRGADISLMNKNNESPLQCAPKDSQSAMALKVNQELKRYSIRRTLNSERLLHRDLSKGKEYYQIQVVNGVDNEPYPIDFMYVTENCEASQINIDRTITSLQSCQCDDDCTSQDCVCGAISFRCWYDKEGKLLPEFNLMDAPMIFECNRACSCWKTCNNRVVQYGVRSRLQVFRTKGKGWGVRALRDIPKGTFVCEYVGEIISDSEADRREDDSYLFDLDNKDGETYCLDARFYGNICRFINHLCQPNLIPVKVFVDHQDLSFPRIALFSSRDIKAYEELGFDYGEKFWVIKYKWFTCSCGSQNCKYNKDTIHNTIENYYKRLRDEQMQNTSPSQPHFEVI